MKRIKMAANELLDSYARGERNFAGIKLEGFPRSFKGADLSNFNFIGTIWYAELVGTNFTNCLFHGADLAESDCTNAIFRNAKFRGATLAQANLTGADFTNASLTRAELDEALMTNTNLTGVSLIGASGVDIDYWLRIDCIFCRTIMPDETTRNDGC